MYLYNQQIVKYVADRVCILLCAYVACKPKGLSHQIGSNKNKESHSPGVRGTFLA